MLATFTKYPSLQPISVRADRVVSVEAATKATSLLVLQEQTYVIGESVQKATDLINAALNPSLPGQSEADMLLSRVQDNNPGVHLKVETPSSPVETLPIPSPPGGYQPLPSELVGTKWVVECSDPDLSSSRGWYVYAVSDTKFSAEGLIRDQMHKSPARRSFRLIEQSSKVLYTVEGTK